MSDQDSIVKDAEIPSVPNKETPTSQDDSTVDNLLGTIKREDGSQKYKSVEAALEALKKSQEHISNLENENRTIKTDLSSLNEVAKRTETMERLLGELTAGKKSEDRPSDTGLTSQEVENIVSKTITEHDRANTVQQNQDIVVNKLLEKFGDVDKADQYFVKKAQELGVSVGFLNDTAGVSPTAVLELLNINTVQQPSDIQGSVDSDKLKPVENQKPTSSVMGGASSAEILAAWRAAGERAEEALKG